MENLLIYLRFKIDEEVKHGGVLRSEQIYNHTKGNSCFLTTRRLRTRYTIIIFFQFIWFLRVNNQLKVFYNSFEMLYDSLQYYYLPLKVLRKKYGTYLTDHCYGNGQILILIAKFLDYKVLAYPHNLESLVPTQKSYFTQKISPNWFYEEVEILRFVDELYVISREEYWILSTLKLQNVRYFPYKVGNDQYARLTRLKHERFSNIHKRKEFLLFGTADNPPTYMGMCELLSFFEGRYLNFSLVVVGIGTEKLRGQFNNRSFDFLGTVSNAQIERLLVSSMGVIIHQYPTSGALTKIKELEVVEIPVFCNLDAARDLMDLNRHVVYESLQELETILNER